MRIKEVWPVGNKGIANKFCVCVCEIVATNNVIWRGGDKIVRSYKNFIVVALRWDKTREPVLNPYRSFIPIPWSCRTSIPFIFMCSLLLSFRSLSVHGEIKCSRINLSVCVCRDQSDLEEAAARSTLPFYVCRVSERSEGS
jgi:hypothetical protein